MATTTKNTHAPDDDELPRRFTAATERACKLLAELIEEVQALRVELGDARKALGDFGKGAGVAGVLGKLFGGR